MIRKITFCVAMLASTSCFAAGRDIEFNINDLYGNPWIETKIVGGTGPYNVWATWSGNSDIPVLNNQLFYVGQETDTIVIRDTFNNNIYWHEMPFPIAPTHQVNLGAVPEPSSILLVILSFLGIRWIKK